MAFLSSDRALWIGTGVVTFFAILAVSNQLQTVIRLVTVNQKPDQSSEKVEEDDEPQDSTTIPMSTLAPYAERASDAIDIETLGKLADGSTWELRAAAVKIIVERMVKSEDMLQLFLNDLTGKQPGPRTKAIHALRFLIGSAFAPKMCTPQTFTAIIDCLCNLSHETRKPLPSYWVLSDPARCRQELLPAEREILLLLRRLLPNYTNMLLEAGLVTRWLAEYQFTGVMHNEKLRQEKVKYLMELKIEDSLLGEVMRFIYLSPAGRSQMRHVGLCASSIRENFDDSRGIIYRPPAASQSSRSANGRRRAENALEQALRRRRREAIVIGEEGQPLGRQNIIQRPAENPSPSVIDLDAALNEINSRSN